MSQDPPSPKAVADTDSATLSAVAAQLRHLSEILAGMCPQVTEGSSEGPRAGEPIPDLVDPEAIRRLADDFGDEAALDIVRCFISELPARIAAIRQHLRTGDDQLLERSKTTLRSGCSLVGAITLAKWCTTPHDPPPLAETEHALLRIASKLFEQLGSSMT